MPDRLSILEARLAELSEAHHQLERRLGALERHAAAPRAPARRQAAPPPQAGGDAGGADLGQDLAAMTKNLALVGRTLLVLAGAFLLRALTDSGTLPTGLGALLGFAYAGAWIAMAYRVGRQAPWSAGFHGLSAVLIAFPLLIEAATRFRLLSPAAAAATLAFFTAVALGVAARRRLQALAWLIEVGGILTAVGLMVATGRLGPPLLYLALLGVGTLWVGYVLDWVYLRWPVAVVADLALIVLALRAVGPLAPEGARTALLVQVVLMAGYLGSIATRTLLLRRSVVGFEVAQTAALLVAGLGGAAYVTVRTGTAQGALGVSGIAFGLATYAVAFAFLERRRQGKANFYFYGAVALVFVLTGTGLLLSGAPLALGWAGLAASVGALARGLKRLTLAVHSAMYAIAAAVQAGLVTHAFTTIMASPSTSWPPASPVALVVLGALAASAWLTGGASRAPPLAAHRVPRCLVLAVVAVAAAGVVVGWAVPLLAGAPGPAASAGVVATLRTAVLVGGVLLLAWMGRLETWREAGWLAYPLLVVIGLKLVLEDLARSRPASLFLAFALYGAALILVPRLRRREAASPQPPDEISVSPGAGS